MDTKTLIEWSGKYHTPNYGRTPLVLVRGTGIRVWDSEGREYLDFTAGIAVTVLGHCHPRVTGAIQEAAATLLHVSNIFHAAPQIHLAKLLVEHSFADRVFFCNSGAEANEAALKLARKYGKERFASDRFEVIATRNSFHGRTLATVTATGQEKYRQGFEPLMPGFKHVAYNDLRAMERAMDSRTAAVLVEPLQGEGGVNVPDDDYLPGLRKLCDESGALLILDEVQTGMGRTGRLWAYEHAGVEPDIMTVAKAIANGVPMGVMLARDEVAAALTAGTHGSTFGGTPFVSAVALATLTTVIEERIPERAARMGRHLVQRLTALRERHPDIKDVRGRGLLIGIELTRPAGPVVDACREAGLLALTAGEPVLRLTPALIVDEADCDRAVEIIDGALARTPEVKHFLSAGDLTREGVLQLFGVAADVKQGWKAGRRGAPLAGRTLALVFEKPSLRTRVTFEVGILQLGGGAVYLAGQEIGLGTRESVPDVARNLSRWVDAIVARVYAHATIETLARHASIPVINALSDREHPCQAMADFFTLWERGLDPGTLRVAWIGDGNNVCHSVLLLGSVLGATMVIACPDGYDPDPGVQAAARRLGGRLVITRDPAEAAEGADVLYTDVWTSMGQEAERERRLEAFGRYQLSDRLVGFAKPSALVMHCLPAHRGEEITDTVLDGPQSIVLDQAENRLHAQKAIVLDLLRGVVDDG